MPPWTPPLQVLSIRQSSLAHPQPECNCRLRCPPRPPVSSRKNAPSCSSSSYPARSLPPLSVRASSLPLGLQFLPRSILRVKTPASRHCCGSARFQTGLARSPLSAPARAILSHHHSRSRLSTSTACPSADGIPETTRNAETCLARAAQSARFRTCALIRPSQSCPPSQRMLFRYFPSVFPRFSPTPQ